MEAAEFEKAIRDATSIIQKNKNRIRDRHGNPGGLVDLSQDNRVVMVVGDLHGASGNLLKIVSHRENEKLLSEGKAILIILGDALHNDLVGQMKEMHSSLRILEVLLSLINRFRENIFYIRGNHDTFDERLRKSGILQGKEFRDYLISHVSAAASKELDLFFEALPFVIVGKGYVITHGGPARGGITRDDIININDNPDLKHQLVWNRLHEFRGTPNMKEYGEYDIRAMLRMLKLPEDTPFIVGHNPMWNTGNRTGIWRNIIGIKNHIIIYSNLETKGPYLWIENGEIKEFFAIEKAAEVLYV